MVKATTVINEVINRVLLDDQTAEPVNAIGTRMEGLQGKIDDVAASGENLGTALVKGMENAETATERAVEVATAGTGKLQSALGHLEDNISQISHDVQLGAKNSESALSDIQDAAQETSVSADGISSAFRDNLKEAAAASGSLADALSQDATKADVSWQAAAGRAGDSISKVQRQIRLLQNEYDRLDARGRAAVASGSTSPEDVTRVLEANKKAQDDAAISLAKLRLEQAATVTDFDQMAESGATASAVIDRMSAADLAQTMALRELRAEFEKGQITLDVYKTGLQEITIEYAALSGASATALATIAQNHQDSINSSLGITLPNVDHASRLEDVAQAFQDADNLRAKLVPLAAAERDYASAIAVASDARERGVIDLGEYLAAMDRATASYQKQKDAIAASVQTQQEALRLQHESVAAGTQEKINTWAGVTTPEYGQADSRQEDFEAAAQDAAKLRAELVPLAAAELDYTKAQQKASAALAAGIIEQGEYDAYMDQATDTLNRQKSALGGNSTAIKLTAFELGILADEAHKFFDQVWAGGSPLQAAFYQVPNMVQVMGGLKNAMSSTLSVLSGPAGLAAGAVAAGAAIGGLGYYAESEQESLAQLSTHLRATRADYDDMSISAENAARALHEQYGDISLSDSRSTTQTIAAVPTVDASQIQRLTADSRDLAAIMGTTVPDAAKTLAVALEDPAREAQALADQHLPGFNAGLVLSVQHMAQMGQQADAVSLVVQRLESAIHGAADQGLTPFQTAWRNLKDEMGSTSSVIAAESRSIGDLFVSMATEGISATDDLVKHLRKLPDELSSIWSSIKSGASTGLGWLEGDVASGIAATAHFAGATNLAHIVAQGSAADPTFSMPTNTAANHSLVQDGGIQSVQSMIDRVAQEQHLNGDITSLMHAIAPAESSTGQYLHGQVVHSSAGAIGAMQVMPSNAAGNDLTDLHGNVSASADYLVHLYDKYHHNQKLVAMAYNWGETALDEYIDGKRTTIPQETSDYVTKVTGGNAYSAVENARMDQSVSAQVLKGNPSIAGQQDDLTRSLQGEHTALGDLDKQYQAHVISQKEWADQTKIIHGQIDTTSASLANLRDPLQEVYHSQTLAAQSASALTGYDRQMVSVAQEVDQAQLSLNGAHASATQIMAAQAREQSVLTDAWHAGTAALSDQTQALSTANAAYADGKISAEDATQYVSAYMDAENSFKKDTPEFLHAMQERIAKAQAWSVEQQNTQMIGQTNQNMDQVAILQTETSLIGTNDDARQKLIAHMEVEQQLYREGRSLTDEYSQHLLASTDALSDATAEYQHAQQVMDAFTGSISDMADQLSDGVVQGFMQGTSAGMSFKTMLQGVEASVASTVARFALINPLMNALDGKTRTTLADIGNLFSETGSESSGSSGVEDPLSAVGQSGWGVSPWEALNMKNQMTSPSFGSEVNAGGVSTASSALENLFSGKAADGSGIFSSFGSAASSIGSYMGMAGAAFGVGEMAYNLLEPLFAKREKDYQYISVDDGQLGISGHVYKDIHGNDTVLPGLQTDLDSINNAFDYTGVSATNTDTIGKVGWSKKGKKSTTYSLTDLLPDLDLTSPDAIMQQELKQLMPTSFDSVDTFTQDLESLKRLADELGSMKVSVSKFDDSSHVTVDHFTGYTGDMAKALSTLDGGTYSVDDLQSKFQAISEFVGTTMPGLLDVTASGSESLMQQVDDLKAKYQDAANTAASYGLDAQALLDKGNSIAAMMVANEQATLGQADQSVQARYLSATGNQEGADLLNQQVSAAQEIQQLQDNWRGFLGDSFASSVTYQQQLADLEKTQNAERLQIQQEYQEKSLEKQQEYLDQADQSVASVFSSLGTYVQGLDTSDASPLSVQQQYQAANQSLNTDYQAAMGGDYNALSRLQSDSQSDLTLAKQWFGSGVDYAKEFQNNLTMLQSVANVDTGQFTAALAKQLSANAVDATNQVTQAVNTMKTAVVAELKQFIQVQTIKGK
ncbi:phage tail protein [Acetobacter sp. DmW_136]|uniref:phage tail length tape measure family protein n=1 Tax=Acetobacter sp. DmW_136 TaxID=2591091 RepID=UPI001238E8A7|nr:phage tail length tape measure family protein [Acetobacter sp. DmW_136]KAA8387771.1 phage tail protein [Acetobacter sp. DmW_136]